MKRNRQKNSLTISHSRWLAYATAGIATTLGGAHSAEAEIHYSGALNVPLQNHHRRTHFVPRDFPLSQGVQLHFSRWSYARFVSVNGAAVSNRLCQYYSSRFGSALYVSRLAQGDVISNCDFDSTDKKGVLFQSYGYTGKFAWPGIGFIPFRFNNGAGMQYGWARIYRIRSDTSMVLVDYAWGDPGDRIKAGQTSSSGDRSEAVTGQGSLGLLALGGAGLAAWRKRRRTERY